MRKFSLFILISFCSLATQVYASQFASFGFNKHQLSDSEECILELIRKELDLGSQKTYVGIFGLTGDSKTAVLSSYIGDNYQVTSCVVQFHSTDGWVWKNKNFQMVLETNSLSSTIDFSFGSKGSFTLNISSCL